ncbi:hypothetical protein [Nostoc sp. DedQUE09]|uniref:hypothetical protein n=1 Tax=Nostoc sp. DedQUE09 TaxID=3075394 RepID=UPI002AD2B185|nr:hypothetical protein [Nostoc sp. DedQUE09]MDZ7955025.1 hypothetical protein [Nostoc sp. DedQUE09]
MAVTVQNTKFRVQRESDRLFFTIIHLWISDVAVVSMKLRVLRLKLRVQNSERRAIYSNIRVLSLNIAPKKCVGVARRRHRRAIFYKAAA